MPWLRRDDEVLASIEARRGVGDMHEAAIVLHRPTLVRTGGHDPIDVAWCSLAKSDQAKADEAGESLVVRRVGSLGGHLPFAPGLWMPVVIVAGAGSFERWRLRPGDQLVITGE